MLALFYQSCVKKCHILSTFQYFFSTFSGQHSNYCGREISGTLLLLITELQCQCYVVKYIANELFVC